LFKNILKQSKCIKIFAQPQKVKHLKKNIVKNEIRKNQHCHVGVADSGTVGKDLVGTA
jgi:hypothetical protein